VFKNRVPWGIFGQGRHEVTGGWRKLHEEESHNVHSSTSSIRMMKPRTMRWPGHVARIGRRKIRRRMHIGHWKESKRKWAIRKTKAYVGE
jgi:hypothetical protein